MKERSGTIIVAIAMSLAVSTTTIPAGETKGELADLMGAADTIVAVEIQNTDYAATPSDGPMYGDARILKVIRGGLSSDTELRFAASAWCGPTYKAGERRVLFLDPVTSKDYYSRAPWATLCFSDSIDFFFAIDSVETLSFASLEAFLKDVQEGQRTPPKITTKVVQKDQSTLVLSIKLINDSEQPLSLNPSRVMASFESSNVRYFRDIEFPDEKQRAWIMIAPAGSITGTVRIANEEVKGTNQIVLLVSHRSVYFPHRSWAGTVQTPPVKVDGA